MDDIDNIYSFLLFTGYLKIEKSSDLYRYYLKIPNKEIEMIYVQIFSQWFDAVIRKTVLLLYSIIQRR